MLQGLLKRAERSIDQVVAKYMGRAMVAVPLVVAGGFATAALTVKLVELYGSVIAYGAMAALFGVIGLLTMAIVNVGPNPAAEAPSAAEAEAAASPEQPQGSAAEAADLLPPELRALFASAAPMALPPVIRGIGKNLPLILFLALVGFIISRFSEGLDSAGEQPGTPSDAADADPGEVAAASAAAAAAAA